MKVLKFGGTSVGTVESLRNVKAIVEQCSEPVIVVVSALGGLTDKLIATAKCSIDGTDAYMPDYLAMIDRHHNIINHLVAPERQPDLRKRVDLILEELGNIYKGLSLIRDLSPRSLDIIVSYGERLSSTIIAEIIDGARLFDSRKFIKTLRQFDKHVLDNDITLKLIDEHFGSRDWRVAIVPGFISTDANGYVTNLGRGGSDYTAAILAAALDAHTLEIWTDVDGFMTADPRVISDAYVVDRMSFVEAMELCNFGAKVIYPPTIYPVFHKNIPIYIKNTFNPDAPGTCISEDRHQEIESVIKGVSSINNTSLITVSGKCLAGQGGVNAKILNTMTRQGVDVLLLSQSSSENSTAFAIRGTDTERAINALNEEFLPELQTGELDPIEIATDTATLAIVGENLMHSMTVIDRLFDALERNGIYVLACAQGTSETNISVVIPMSECKKALRVIHDTFFSKC